jgi:hypothetical protein
MEESYPKAKFFFRWYDMWIGAYYDRRDRRLFVCPLPMVGIVFDFGPRNKSRSQERIDYFAKAYKDIPPIGYVIPKEDMTIGGVVLLKGQKYSLLRGPEADEYGNKDAFVWVVVSPIAGAFWAPTTMFEVHKTREAA